MASRSTTAGALETGEIDVGMLETTDANLLNHDFVQLEDDRRLQPAENVVPIVRNQILAAYGPALAGVIDAVTAQLKTVDLIHMNQRVQLQGVNPATAAAQWLLQHPAKS
jgi:osmoprotectant transport system substrate-binding protein